MLIENYREINIYFNSGVYFYNIGFISTDINIIREEINLKWMNYESKI